MLLRRSGTVVNHSDYFFDAQVMEKAFLDVTNQVPHYGRKLGILVRAAKINPRPKGAPDEYDRIKPFFDAEFYFSRYPDIARVEMDPVWHYIRSGAAEGRDPSPLFSTKVYVKQHPEAACGQNTPFDDWLRYTRKKGKRHMSGHPAFHPGITAVLGLDRKQIQQHFEARHRDIRARLAHGELGRMVIKAAAIEPSLDKSWPQAFNMKITPFTGYSIVERRSAIYQWHEQLDWHRAAIVMVVDSSTPHSPIEPAVLREAIECVGKDNVILIDTARKRNTRSKSTSFTGSLSGVRSLWLHGQENRDAYISRRLLVDLLSRIRPALVIGSESPMLWSVVKPNAFGKAMNSMFRVAFTLPLPSTSMLGYCTSLNPEAMVEVVLPFCDLLICPNKNLRDEVIKRFCVPAGNAGCIVTLDDVLNRKIFAEIATEGAMAQTIQYRGTKDKATET